MRRSFCEVCGPPRQAEFTVSRVSESSGGTERNLCETCAKDAERIMFGGARLPLTDLLQVLVLERSGAASGRDRTKVCPVCGNTGQVVLDTGAVGCSTCYSVFRDEIEEVVRTLHGASAFRRKPA